MDILKDLIMECVACAERYVVSKGYQLELHKRIEKLQEESPKNGSGEPIDELGRPIIYTLPKRCPACREIKRIKFDQKKKLYELRQKNKSNSTAERKPVR